MVLVVESNRCTPDTNTINGGTGFSSHTEVDSKDNLFRRRYGNDPMGHGSGH